MQVFDSNRQPGNGMQYDTASNTTVSGNGIFEGSLALNFTETNENEGPELRAKLKQMPMSRLTASSKLEDLTQLVQ